LRLHQPSCWIGENWLDDFASPPSGRAEKPQTQLRVRERKSAWISLAFPRLPTIRCALQDFNFLALEQALKRTERITREDMCVAGTYRHNAHSKTSIFSPSSRP
ncbi:unnamed protein product, partial [Rangifer tarandus platyrhynchus]